MIDILLVTPPFVQPNTPYPATAYLKSYLSRQGLSASQYDLSLETLLHIFSQGFLKELFSAHPREIFGDDTGVDTGQYDNLKRIYGLRKRYVEVVEFVIGFLQKGDTASAIRICCGGFLPQAGRFSTLYDTGELFGTLGVRDCAVYLSTLFLQDISDYIRATVSDNFEISRYGEKISVSIPEFSILEQELNKKINAVEQAACTLLADKIREHDPAWVGFTVPFPGNLLMTLRCCQYIRKEFPGVRTLIGGGYPSTELRSMTEQGIFRYVDHILIDDAERELADIVKVREAEKSVSACGIGETGPGGMDGTRTRDPLHNPGEIGCGSSAPDTLPDPAQDHPEAANRNVNGSYGESEAVTSIPGRLIFTRDKIKHLERGCPDYSGLDHDKYFSLNDSPSPMLRLWNDGRWNKMSLAHGCYWGKCAFCDTSLPYIKDHDTVPATTIADWMEQIAATTGSSGFHFTDEAAPVQLLRDLSLELLRRGKNYTWWTNIRFDPQFTGDLCMLMAEAGCVAVSGGLETAGDRLLKMMGKGIDMQGATLALRNLSRSGIMVHAYLMYAFPTQTLQETVDALELVRQLFRAGLIDSAFWHRFAMTCHSRTPAMAAKWGLQVAGTANPFANNEIHFKEKRDYNPTAVGDSLRTALNSYMAGTGLEKNVRNWFGRRAPAPTLDQSFVADQLIKPDASRLYDPNASLIWTGPDCGPTEEGLLIRGAEKNKAVKLPPLQARFMSEVIARASMQTVSLEQVADQYAAATNEDSFLAFYHSKKWDIFREYGLLQI